MAVSRSILSHRCRRFVLWTCRVSVVVRIDSDGDLAAVSIPGSDEGMVEMESGSADVVVPELSIVIPAYNEVNRLGGFLDSVSRYLTSPGAPRSEVIVVDDGSTDGTSDLVDRWGLTCPLIRCLRHPQNRGKGAAVRTGLLATEGALLLFADADGATPIEEERRLRAAITIGADVAIGSRIIHGSNVHSRRLLRRRLMGRVFSSLVRRYIDLPVLDTQCGFKMLRSEMVLPLVRQCVTDGYLFDIELLARAHRSGLRITEVAVSWRDVPGSKIRLVRDSLAMWRGLKVLQQSLAAEE